MVGGVVGGGVGGVVGKEKIRREIEMDEVKRGSRVADARFDDSVRIAYPHKAVTMPASLIFSVDESLKSCREIGQALIVYRCSEEVWLAECGGDFVGRGPTPIQAIAAMEPQ